VKTRFYLRALVDDRPGVLAEVTRVLADHHISIASVIQHESPEEPGVKVQLVIMSHTAPTGGFRAAVGDLDRLACVGGPCVYYPVGD
jgi:homoserine dehydrogenase